MIDPKAEPIANRNPYKPIDVSGRKKVVEEKPDEPTLAFIGLQQLSKELCKLLDDINNWGDDPWVKL